MTEIAPDSIMSLITCIVSYYCFLCATNDMLTFYFVVDHVAILLSYFILEAEEIGQGKPTHS